MLVDGDVFLALALKLVPLVLVETLVNGVALRERAPFDITDRLRVSLVSERIVAEFVDASAPTSLHEHPVVGELPDGLVDLPDVRHVPDGVLLANSAHRHLLVHLLVHGRHRVSAVDPGLGLVEHEPAPLLVLDVGVDELLGRVRHFLRR